MRADVDVPIVLEVQHICKLDLLRFGPTERAVRPFVSADGVFKVLRQFLLFSFMQPYPHQLWLLGRLL